VVGQGAKPWKDYEGASWGYIRTTMGLLTVVAGVAVLAAGLGLAFSAGRKHRRERHEVENFFAGEQEDQAWWEGDAGH
jgi:hypothetical protein